MSNDIQQMLNDAFAEILQRDYAQRRRIIESDPKAHKLTMLFDGSGPRWRYYTAGKDGRGWEVRFCWTTNRNLAGYFLSFREAVPPKGSKAKHGRRNMFAARKVRKRAKALALARAEAFRRKQA